MQSPFRSNSRGRLPHPGPYSTRLPSVGSDGNESPHPFMDIDKNGFSADKGKQAEDARTFALSDTLSVRLAAIHPIEMQQAFQASVISRDRFIGSIHVLNMQSYSVVTSVQTCYVWKIDLNSPFHPPTCYIFPAPLSTSSIPYLTPPFASLFSFGSSREPGLILVSPSGDVRFWDSLGTGLAGADRFSTTRIGLAEGETVEGIDHVDAAVYVARTKTRLHRLTVAARPGTGKFVVVATPFTDPQDYEGSSWLYPFRILHRRNAGWEGDILAVVSPSVQGDISSNSRESVLRGGDERSVWVLTNRNLMKWAVNLESGERCEVNHAVKDIVARAILNGAEGQRWSLDIELLDVGIDSTGDPVLLISHAPLNIQELSPAELDTVPARIYALVRLRLPSHSEAFVVDSDIEVLPYELNPDPQRASSPRLGLFDYSAEDGIADKLKLAFTQFSDAFAFTSVVPPYQEQLHLKSADDMILGFNSVEHANGREFLLLTSGMVLAARVNFANILKMKDDVHVGKANVLMSTILQAMKYGVKFENPLRFQLPSIADGESLKVAAEQMSYAFLTSNQEVVVQNLSVGVQLSARQSALQALVTFIGGNGGLSKLSQSTREQLLADAEKLAAARGLWDCHSELTQKSRPHSLLPTAIEVHLSRVDAHYEGDALRTFFNFHVQNVGALGPEILNIVRDTLSSSETPRTKLQFLAQANELVQALVSRAFQYRSENRPKYQIKSTFIQPWTSEPSLLIVLRRLFDMTAQFRTQGTEKMLGSDEDVFGDNTEQRFTLQMQELASCLFKAYQDRLDFLDCRSPERGGNEREHNRLNEEFRSVRSEVLNYLVRIESADYAFQLAETYRDFHALCGLSYHASVNKVMPADKRIREYIHKFRQDFSSELYKWYIEQGKLRLMFDQEAEFWDDVEHFLKKNPAPRVSWIHDVGKQEYNGAASALLEEAGKETNRKTRHLMLSIGKLACMADGPAATPQDKVEAFNNSLDFIAIHDALLEQFSEEFGSIAEFAIDARVQAISSAKCAIPRDRPALIDLFQRILRQLLHGNALLEEDAVDLLSMKYNRGRTSDFVDALTIINNSPYMSESRKSTCIRNVWRRIYISDNWAEIRNTANANDYTLAENLRETQLYKTLASPPLPRNTVLFPTATSQTPTAEEVEARWPGMAPNQVADLCRDFARESNFVTENGPSDAEFLHVRQLAEDDMKGKI